MQGGTYLSPAFMCQNITDITGIPDGNWKGTPSNYTTAVVGNVSIAWIQKVRVPSSETATMTYPKVFTR